ncbi:Wzz/FepE/Etk N-terminal domain-containing protein [Halomonas sp. HK25]|uniref:Wzz/FepE/Etk N-terminal domain-containing protein n=1 Tax=Halomonas sp. HK25 TaxID=3394321 RepID=UPI0039FC8C72
MTNNDSRPPADALRSSASDEISLVDLAKILINRWKLMAVTFAVVVLVALAYALLTPKTYDYVSLYRVALKADQDALESPAAAIAKANNLYLGSVTRNLLEGEGLRSLPFETGLSNPNDTFLIRLASQAAESDVALVQALHEQTLVQIAQGQQALLEERKATLERQLNSARRSLELAQESTSPFAADLVSSYSEKVANLEDRIAQLQPGQKIQVAVQSLEPSGTSRKLIMALAIVFGGMLAVIVAFFVQFAFAVKSSLQKG